jgi:energy-converting hydrogenase Eha subunit E
MDTSGDGTANVILYLVVLALFAQIVARVMREWRVRPTVPWLALLLAVVVGVPSLVQFAWPSIGDALMRDPPLTLHDGQWWRVVTSVAAQDGGLVAAIFNLVVIVGVVAAAEWLMGWWRALVLFVVPSIILNLLAIAWNAQGGGSSFASDGLLASVVALALVRSRSRVVRWLGIAVIAIGIALVAINDAHGLALLVGAALGAAFALLGRRHQPEDA